MDFEILFHRNSLFPRFTAIACAICAVIFVGLQLGGPNMSWAQYAHWGHYPTAAIWNGAPWALVTSVFVHFEIWHIAFNLYWLWALGNRLEDAVGPWRWLLFFLGAAWVSSAAELFTSGDTGIGMSGVGYALFGFAWVARRRIPNFDDILSDQTVNVFLIWLVGCMVATYFHLVNIGNAAHLAGLAFGVAVAGVFVLRWRLPVSVAGLMALIALSVLPIFWCPLSPGWTSRQAVITQTNGDYEAAIYWYRRCLAQGQDSRWVWSNLSLIYLTQGNRKEYANAMKEMAKATAVEGAGGQE